MRYLVRYEHKLHDNGRNLPAIIYAKSEEEASKIFERDNPDCYVTFVEEDFDGDDE